MASRKARPDSRLKTLDEARQAEIWEYARTHSLDDTVRWLRAAGLRTSRTAVSNFLAWYALQQQLRRNETVVETLLEHLRSQGTGWTAEQLEQAGQAFFAALALAQQDVRAWAMTQRLALQREQLRLGRDRLAWMRRRAEQADQAERIATSGLSDGEKLSRIRDIFGLTG
jgi:hypothetical protein